MSDQRQEKAYDKTRCLRIYAIYADEDSESRERLERMVAPLIRAGLCRYEDRSQMEAGTDRSTWLAARHEVAELVLVLASADLVADGPAQAELAAVQAHGQARILPIVVRPVDLSLSPSLGELRSLPVDVRSIAESPQSDRAWQEIQAELKRQLLRQAVARPRSKSGERPTFYVPRLLWAVLAPCRAGLLVLLGILLLLGCYNLGEAALQARAELLGIDPDTFSYPWLRPFVEGARVLPGVVWRIALLSGGSGAERTLWTLPAILFALPLLLSRWPRVQLAARGLSLLGAALGALALVAVVRLHHVALDASGQAGPSHPAVGSVLDEAAFEIASWLRNGGDANDQRRAALVGLYGLGLLSCLGLLGQGIWRSRGRALDRAIAVGMGLTTLLLTAQAPRAYALSRWGLLYRPVLDLAPGCSSELAAGLAKGVCTAWDLSEGARPEVLLLRGVGCPGRGSQQPAVLVLENHTPGGCVLLRGDREPVLKGG